MTKCKITSVNQSPLNAQRWYVELSCGNSTWLMRRKKPKIGVGVDCSACTPIGRTATNETDKARPDGVVLKERIAHLERQLERANGMFSAADLELNKLKVKLSQALVEIEALRGEAAK